MVYVVAYLIAAVFICDGDAPEFPGTNTPAPPLVPVTLIATRARTLGTTSNLVSSE